MSKSVTEKIILKLAPSSIISKYISIKSQGRGEFIGLCPFHHEKTPSFTVSDEKGFYHCFGCGKHGNIFDFVMQMEGIDFRTALTKLAKTAGVEIPEYDKKKQEKTDIYYKIYNETANFYKEKLMSPIGRQAFHYLEQRGITLEDIDKFYLGYAPNDSSLLEDYLLKSFTKQDILAAKVLKVGKKDRLYDPFYNRVIFPIYDKMSRCIAFGGRILDDGQPKYLNSSESPLFVKGEHLYGLNFCLKQAYDEKSIIITEGYMDVIALIKNNFVAAAPLGTALKVSQITDLWKTVDRITLCLDNDRAGINAVNKVCNEILPQLRDGKSLFIANMTGGKDPDEIIKNKGTAYFDKIIKLADPLSEFLFSTELKKMVANIPEEKAKLRGRLDSFIKRIENYNVKQSFREYFYNRRQEKFGYRKKSKNDEDSDNSALNKKASLQLKRKRLSKEDDIVLNILLNVIYNPIALSCEMMEEQICQLEIQNAELDNLRNYVLALNYDGEIGDKSEERLNEIFKIIKNFERDKIKSIINIIQKNGVEESKNTVKNLFLNYNLHTLQKQVKLAESELLMSPSEDIYKRLISLKQEENQLIEKINNNI